MTSKKAHKDSEIHTESVSLRRRKKKKKKEQEKIETDKKKNFFCSFNFFLFDKTREVTPEKIRKMENNFVSYFILFIFFFFKTDFRNGITYLSNKSQNRLTCERELFIYRSQGSQTSGEPHREPQSVPQL